jgi:uncharacterized protein with HEPN domain
MPKDYKDQDRLELIVELIGHIQRRLPLVTKAAFLAIQDEIDLTAFRLLHIGEASNKLTGDLKARHPDIPWVDIYLMRNIVSHDYFGVKSDLVWETATTKLDELLDMCRIELARISK